MLAGFSQPVFATNNGIDQVTWFVWNILNISYCDFFWRIFYVNLNETCTYAKSLQK